jgi:hypothetical protein
MAEMTSSTLQKACPSCGTPYSGQPEQCSRCGSALGEARRDFQRDIEAARGLAHARKNMADAFFLVGLLLGGPTMTLGGNVQLGLFIVLAGGVASVLRRYTGWSTPGTIVVGSIAALTLATWLVDPSGAVDLSLLADEDARAGYILALDRGSEDIIVEARGIGLEAAWFTVPELMGGECETFPGEAVRTHLRELGFSRIVVTDRNLSGGQCSFTP